MVNKPFIWPQKIVRNIILVFYQTELFAEPNSDKKVQFGKKNCNYWAFYFFLLKVQIKYIDIYCNYLLSTNLYSVFNTNLANDDFT